MKIRKITSLLLCLVMIITAFSGCAKISEKELALSEWIVSVFRKDKKPDGNTDGEETEEVKLNGIPSKLDAEKIGSFSSEDNAPDVLYGGIVYHVGSGDSEKYGIASFDGKHDSGAVYARVEDCGDNFLVSKTKGNTKDATSLNCSGLVDAEGNQILEEKYLSIKSLNEQYLQVYEATGFTKNEDEAIMYITDNAYISIQPDEDDLLIAGKWTIYDLVNKRFVKDILCTNNYSVTCKGQFISYADDNEKSYDIDADGNPAPECETIFENGNYWVEDDTNKKGTVYDDSGKKLFEFSTEQYDSISYNASSDCYTTYKYINTDEGEYYVMDLEGKIVSKAFKKNISVTGKLICCDDKLYNFDGQQVFKDKIKFVNVDQFGQVYRVTDENETEYLIDVTGKVLTSKKKNDDSISMSYTPYKNTGDSQKLYFSYKDANYKIEGYQSVADCAIQTKTQDENYNLVDVYSNSLLLKNYEDFEDNNTKEGVIIAARNADSDKWDVYRVTPK